MGYRELSVYLWHLLDKLYVDNILKEGAIVLDVGGDYSNWGWFFKDRNVEQYDIINLYRPDWVPPKPMRFFHLDAHNLQSLRNESYDFALSKETLEHLYDPIRAVDEMTRLLKPGGIIFLSGMCTYGYHPSPRCYWRIYADAVDYMLRGFDVPEIIGFGGGGPKDPMGIWAWGSKRNVPRNLKIEKAEGGWDMKHLSNYRYIQDDKTLSQFLAKRGYIFEEGIELLRDKQGKLIGVSPDLKVP